MPKITEVLYIIRYHFLKDGTVIGSAATREQALMCIREYQKLETHPVLRSEYSIIKGEEEFISYPKRERDMER